LPLKIMWRFVPRSRARAGCVRARTTSPWRDPDGLRPTRQLRLAREVTPNYVGDGSSTPKRSATIRPAPPGETRSRPQHDLPKRTDCTRLNTTTARNSIRGNGKKRVVTNESEQRSGQRAATPVPRSWERNWSAAPTACNPFRGSPKPLLFEYNCAQPECVPPAAPMHMPIVDVVAILSARASRSQLPEASSATSSAL
jgi:hypothetical protein